jgi:hypothetical protein
MERSEQLRDIMIAEIETGAGGTDIRCGVIKVAPTGASPMMSPRGCSRRRSLPLGDRRAGHHPYVEPDQAV